MRRDEQAPISKATADAAWRAIFEAACAPYRYDDSLSSRWAWHWARGKLSRDPVFRGMLERGDLPAHARVVDIGCGQGLVASLLHACADAAAHGAWPAHWPAAPSATAYHGVELMPKDAARGNAAFARLRDDSAVARLRGANFQPHIACIDMCRAELPACDVVVILDVLHYVDFAAQDGVLRRVRDALQAGAGPRRLLLRVGDAAHARGITITKAVDWVVTTARGHRVPPTWVRTLDEWTAALQALGFGAVQRVPMSQGTPFANVLLVSDLQTGPAQ